MTDSLGADAHARPGSSRPFGIDETPLTINADEALAHLRRKVGQRLKSGPNGLMRCWVQFRERSGSSKEGITFEEFKRGLRNYDLILKEAPGHKP